MEIMRAGRARWKAETFNTLKNQGYCFGHGQNNLSIVFTWMLVFLLDSDAAICSNGRRQSDPAGKGCVTYFYWMKDWKTGLIAYQKMEAPPYDTS